ncbi:hypothetical protein [Paenibacillus sp. FSL H3-0333]|uniref:hypothetical protein n=1 Tax=Paenibacillus sp. FSL H3-0333 TaxID=2921373 RepID=UPI0030F7A59A
MYDVKPIVRTLLLEISGLESVTDAYPTATAQYPCISFYEIGNNNYMNTNNVFSDISIQIDVWSKGSTGVIAQKVEEKMNSIGFIRQFAADVPDTNIKHKTMRYHGIIDSRDNSVKQ